ncbi:MAG: hypothetical protein H7256_01930 [Bdellovibrio sp.]|nr:hypothetical protein [Bdellovibrio sp.]
MDFEMTNFEMIESHSSHSPSPPVASPPQSLILNEIHKENEDLQVKLKLNYRRLLLFETENNKLMEEKNKYYFEMQNYFEKNQLLTERNNELEKENQEFESRLQLLNEKVYTIQKINESQLVEIKRFSKFHVKIQDVVKPFILQLKTQLTQAKQELTRSLKLNQQLQIAQEELLKKHAALATQRQAEVQINQNEKTNLISTYEEQIHSFSKEILGLQNKLDEKEKEVSRLKKSIEFKNYFENELIKFKRIHEEDQTQLNMLIQAKTILELQLQTQASAFAQLKIESAQVKNRFEEKEMTLESTRHQLSKQIDDAVLLNERLNRLEKLNNQLSREMTPT